MAVVIGTPGEFPRVTIGGNGGPDMYVLHGADLSRTDTESGLSKLSVRSDRYFDDEHDRSYLAMFEVVGLSIIYTHSMGFSATSYLTKAFFYDERVTIEKWAESKSCRMVACPPSDNPSVCDYYHRDLPHVQGAPFMPPRRSIIGPYDSAPDDHGPRSVKMTFLWKDDEES